MFPAIYNISSDLAPGDQNVDSFAFDGVQVLGIVSDEDPAFEQVFSRFWTEFGHKGEIEARDVLVQRLKWNPAEIVEGFHFGYQIIQVSRGDTFIAARDHSVIIARSGPNPMAVVHLSHVLIEKHFRGQGLAPWLRSWPVQFARECIRRAGLAPERTPVTLVAEMEAADLTAPEKLVRLKSYQRAGFKRIDSERVQYLQPDFRATAIIDATLGPVALPLQLIIRRVGRELEPQITARELRSLVQSLYYMYGRSFRASDMAIVWNQLETAYPNEGECIRLLPPLGDTSIE